MAVHRKHIKRYYEQWLVCTDPTCRLRTRTDYKLGSKGTIKCRAKKNGATCNNVMNVEVRTPSRLAICVLNVGFFELTLASLLVLVQYSEKDLHNQLQYYARLFDLSKLTEGTSTSTCMCRVR